VLDEWWNAEEQVMEYTCDECMTFGNEEEIDEWWKQRLSEQNWQQPE